MVIQIDDRCIKLIDKKDEYKNFFNSLAYEINRGNNFYFFSKKALEELYNNDKLERFPKEIYRKMFNKCYEDNAIVNSVNRRIVVKEKTQENKIIFEGNKFIVPIDCFVNLEYSKKINIIAENNLDCEFFKKIAKVYMNRKKISSVKLQLDNQPGGGNTISDVYANKIIGGEFSVTLVDTDRKYFNCPEGNTSKTIERRKNQLISENNYIEIVEIVKLDVHEIENLIPIDMISKFYDKNPDEEKRNDTINFLKKFAKNQFNEENPLSYFDMKEGIKKESCQSKPIYKEYWKEVLEQNSYIYDEENLIKGFGDKILRKIEQYIGEEIEKENFYKDNINVYLRKQWNDIGKIIYSYGCARERSFC